MPDDINTKQLEKSHKLGLVQASYLVGFGSALKTLEFSEDVIAQIVLAKMQLEYSKEMLRMELESNENISERQSEKIIQHMKDENR